MSEMTPVIDEKYRIISEIGRGGMGVVYEAIHLGLGHRVAVKFLCNAAMTDESVLARFAREARAGANIASEHVARVHDLGMTPDNVPYLVMELLDGDDLANVLEQHPRLRIDDAVRFALQISSAVAEAHAIGIIHRDLKPENIFLQTRRGAPPTVKILDFGLAKIRTQVDAARTDAQLVFGTPKYMAPEQLKSTRDAGPEADVWAIGAITYQMLTGRRPFDGPVLSVVVADVLTKQAPPIREIRPEVPEELAAAVMQCLERDPARRPTIAAFAEALIPFARGCEELGSRIQATTSVVADLTGIATTRRIPRRSSAAKRSGTSRKLWLATLGLMLIVLFLSGITVSLLFRVRHERTQASAERALRPSR
jgi:eukaryotic-like serine/threonine-protein kinase